MLRRHHRFFQSVQVIRDAAVVLLSFFLAYGVRFYAGLLPYGTISEPEETFAIALMVVMVWPTVAWIGRLYVSHRTRSMVAEVFDVFKATAVAFLVLATLTYFVREVRYSRATLILWACFAFVNVSTIRLVSRATLRFLRIRGYNLRHVVVVGAGELAAQVLRTIRRQSNLGLRIVGVIAHDDDGDKVGGHVAEVPVLGTVSNLGETLHRRQEDGNPIDQVIVALPVDKLAVLKKIMKVLSQETVDVRLIPDIYQYVTLCGSVEDLSGLPMINLQASPLSGWNQVGKRAFDILLAGLGMVLGAPLFIMIAALVKQSSRGPIFFRQQRVGLDGREFWMYKFRTMRVDAEACGSRMTACDDPRRTRLGALLRRTSADELPQLWNVLRGDMSLVGPRPEQPAFIADFKREIPRYALRHKIKAGMTGWAQVNGMRGNTSIAKRIELDLYYIENWSMTLDLKIILRTVFGGFLSPNAY